jgi:hypothetical protein
MITLELLTDFIHEYLRYNKDIICDSFTIYDKMLDIKVKNLSNTVREFGEVVKLEKYYNWLQSVREEKINQIL